MMVPQKHFMVLVFGFAIGGQTVHLSQTTLVDGGPAPTKRSSLKNRSTGWPLDVLMCEIMLLWYNIHRVWLAIHMWPYLPNGFRIWVDRSTIGLPASIVMHLTRNKAEINFPWSLYGALSMALCLCPREHLLHFCWPLCPFPYEHIAPIEMITAFQSVVKTTGHTFRHCNSSQST